MTVGNKGRVVLPADIRQGRNWTEGTVLIALETDEGVLLLTRDELLQRVQAEFAEKGKGMLEEFFADRRAEAAREDAETTSHRDAE